MSILQSKKNKLIISMKTVDSGTKQKRLQMMKKVSLKVIDLLNASYPKKGKLHLNIKKRRWWMGPCPSFNPKKINSRVWRSLFGKVIGVNFQSISSTICKFYGSICTKILWHKHCQSPFQLEFKLPTAHKETHLIHIFHIHKQIS